MIPVFTHDAFSDKVFGGVGRYIVELHASFRRRGIESLVLAPLHKTPIPKDLPGVVGVGLPQGFQFRGSTRAAFALGRAMEPLFLRFIEGRRANDVILHRTYYTATRPPARVASVFTVYDMIQESFPTMFAAGDPASDRKRLWSENADVVIAISHHTKSELVRRFDINPDRVTVCHLAATKAEPDTATLARLENTPPFLLYVGRRSGYKNFDRFVEAFASTSAGVEGLRMVAFGDPPTPSETAQLGRLGIAGRATFATGADAVLAAFYARALALVYPSLDEGFGLPPLEAMQHGCAVIASTGGAIPEVIGEAGLLFDPTNVEAIAHAIDAVASDDILRSRLIRSGFERAAEFSWDATADATLDVYASALENARARQ